MSTDVTLTIPAQPHFVRLLRAVVASVGAQLDLTYDRIDDLRMVVDEASAQLLQLPAQNLTMKVTPGQPMVIEVCSDAPANGAWPPRDLEESLAWRVLSALTDDVRFETTDRGPAVTIEMETGAR